MKRVIYLLSLSLFVVIGVLAIPGITAACPANSHFTTLYSNNDLDELKKLHPTISDCKNNTMHFYNFFIAQALYKDMDAHREQLTPQEIKDRLNEIYRLNKEHWPTLYELGEATESIASLASWKTGYSHYEKTLKVINNRSKTPENDVPPDDFIQKVRSKLGLLRNLISVRDPGFLPQDSPRSGGYISRTRSSKVEKMPFPIRFDYNESQLKGVDLENSRLLLKELSYDKPRITIVGHTDIIGSHEYNKKLSEKRAEALGKFLIENGYNKADIQLLGKGQREPVKISPLFAEELSSDEINTLNRRVEIVYHH